MQASYTWAYRSVRYGRGESARRGQSMLVQSPPALSADGQLVYVCPVDDTVYCLRAASQENAWCACLVCVPVHSQRKRDDRTNFA